MIARTAGADLAPCGLVILAASAAAPPEIRPASPAIQTATRDQVGVGEDFFHGFLHPADRNVCSPITGSRVGWALPTQQRVYPAAPQRSRWRAIAWVPWALPTLR